MTMVIKANQISICGPQGGTGHLHQKEYKLNSLRGGCMSIDAIR